MNRLVNLLTATMFFCIGSNAQGESTEKQWCPAKCAPEVTIDMVRSSLQFLRFSGFAVYGTPQQLDQFNSIVADLKQLGLKSDLEWETRSPGQYETIVLSSHPEILLAGSFSKRCDGKELNPHLLYFIDIDTVSSRFSRCEKPLRSGGKPSWATTQCGLLAHELIEAAQWQGSVTTARHSGNAHVRGIRLQNQVRQELGVQPPRTLREKVEVCAAGSKENSDCSVVFDGLWNGHVETIQRKCDNQIEGITYERCSKIIRGDPGWEDCVPVSGDDNS